MTSSHNLPPEPWPRTAGPTPRRSNRHGRPVGRYAFIKARAGIGEYGNLGTGFGAKTPGGNGETAMTGGAVSDAEIVQLVSVSLESALLAASERDPRRFLELRACRGRDVMRKAIRSLPIVQSSDPTVQDDYRKAILFQNVALDLAIALVDAIDRYAHAVDLTSPID